jgi:hypothetical protein
MILRPQVLDCVFVELMGQEEHTDYKIERLFQRSSTAIKDGWGKDWRAVVLGAGVSCSRQGCVVGGPVAWQREFSD